MRTTRRLPVLAVLAAAAFVPLTSSGGEVAVASTTNTGYIIWAPGTANQCRTQIDHRVAYGGALATTWTPDPVNGGPTCWSTYATIHSTGGSATSSGGNPSSAVLISGATPTSSDHLACYGLFNCDPAWVHLG